jgi:hypothetical protein
MTKRIGRLLLALCTLRGVAFPFSATVAVDSSSPPRVIGPITEGGVLLKIDGEWVEAAVSPAGFTDTGVTLLYATPDCSGQADLAAPPEMFARSGISGGTASGILYFPDLTQVKQCSSPFDLQSNQFLMGDGTPGQCTKQASCAFAFAPIKTFDLSTLKLKPPFQLRR